MSSETMIYSALVNYFIRQKATRITTTQPDYPAIAVYNPSRDVLEWADCTDVVVLRSLARVAPDNVNRAALELCELAGRAEIA